jgi:hypothetical protein
VRRGADAVRYGLQGLIIIIIIIISVLGSCTLQQQWCRVAQQPQGSGMCAVCVSAGLELLGNQVHKAFVSMPAACMYVILCCCLAGYLQVCHLKLWRRGTIACTAAAFSAQSLTAAVDALNWTSKMLAVCLYSAAGRHDGGVAPEAAQQQQPR